MKRLLLVIVAAAVAAIALPLGAQAASGPSAEGTGQSSTYGSVHVNAHPVPFSTQHPFGAEGHFFIKKQGVQGDVLCIRTFGPFAAVGGVDTATQSRWLIIVQDGGSPGHGNDQHSVRPATNQESETCVPNNTGPPLVPIQQGNYVVSD